MDGQNLYGRTEFSWTHGICIDAQNFLDAPLNLHGGVVDLVGGGSVINKAYPV